MSYTLKHEIEDVLDVDPEDYPFDFICEEIGPKIPDPDSDSYEEDDEDD